MEKISSMFVIVFSLLVFSANLSFAQNSTTYRPPVRPSNRALCPVNSTPEDVICTTHRMSAGFAGEIWKGCNCRANCRNVTLYCNFASGRWVMSNKTEQTVCQMNVFSRQEMKFELKSDGKYEVSCNIVGFKVKPEKYSIKCESGKLFINSDRPKCERDEVQPDSITTFSPITMASRRMVSTIPPSTSSFSTTPSLISTINIVTTNVPEKILSSNTTSEPSTSNGLPSMVYTIIIALGSLVILFGVILLIVLIIWIVRKKCECCDSSASSYVDPNEIRYRPGLDTVRTHFNIKSHHSYAEINTPIQQQFPITDRTRIVPAQFPYTIGQARGDEQFYNVASSVIYDDVGPPETHQK